MDLFSEVLKVVKTGEPIRYCRAVQPQHCRREPPELAACAAMSGT
jgi:hypothetical protein